MNLRSISSRSALGLAALLVASVAVAGGDDHRRTRNVAAGKTVAGTGTFFVGGFGPRQVVDFGSVTDGVFFEPGQVWTAGAVWWDEGVDATHNLLTVYLGGTYRIRRLVLQVDNNDDYRVSWTDEIAGPTSVTVSPVFIGGGLAEPVVVEVRAITSSFTIEHVDGTRGDGAYAVSEFRAYGKKCPRRGSCAFRSHRDDD